MQEQQPICPHFSVCGGCSLQHLTQEAITTKKLSQLSLPHSPLQLAYGAGRRRVTWHVKERKLGFTRAKSHEIVEITQCPILEPALQASLPLAREIMKIVEIDCDIHITLADNGLDIHIKANRPLNTRQRPKLLMMAPDIARCTYNDELVLQSQEPYVTIAGAKVFLPLSHFLQATKVGEESLISLITSNLGKAKNVVELFSGLGTFTLPIAKQVRVTSFEMHAKSIDALNRTVKNTQGLKPIVAMTRDLFRNPVTTKELNEFDCVVIDPPRAGAQKQYEAIAKSNIKRVLAVSCNVETFERDAQLLFDAGFVLQSLTPVDQFQFSEHLETFAVLLRK